MMNARALAGAIFSTGMVVVFLITAFQRACTPAPRADAPKQVVTATAEDWMRVVEAIGKMHAGELSRVATLQRKLEGVRQLQPGVHTQYLKPVDPDIATRLPLSARSIIRGAGKDVAAYYYLPTDSGLFARSDSAISFKNCDERLELIGGKWECDPARLGHFGPFCDGAVAAPASALSFLARNTGRFDAGCGLQWRPYFRSADNVSLQFTWRGNLELRVRKGFWF